MMMVASSNCYIGDISVLCLFQLSKMVITWAIALSQTGHHSEMNVITSLLMPISLTNQFVMISWCHKCESNNGHFLKYCFICSSTNWNTLIWARRSCIKLGKYSCLSANFTEYLNCRPVPACAFLGRCCKKQSLRTRISLKTGPSPLMFQISGTVCLKACEMQSV